MSRTRAFDRRLIVVLSVFAFALAFGGQVVHAQDLIWEVDYDNNRGSDYSVGRADVNGDGVPDLLVGEGYSGNGPPYGGRVQAFSGVDGSRVFVLIAGRIPPHTPYSGGDIGTKVKAGDLLVTEGPGSLRAVVGHKGVDPRAVLGRVSDRSLLTIIP